MGPSWLTATSERKSTAPGAEGGTGTDSVKVKCKVIPREVGALETETLKLGEWLQQVPGKGPEVSVQDCEDPLRLPDLGHRT